MTGYPNEAPLDRDLGDPASGISARKARSRARARGGSAAHRKSAAGVGCSGTVQASVASGSTLPIVVSARARQTSLIKHPISCLRAAWVVVAAGHSPGRSCASATIPGALHGVHQTDRRAGRVADSRSRRSTSASFASQSRAHVRPTRRFSGSTARNRRRPAPPRTRPLHDQFPLAVHRRACCAICSMAAIALQLCRRMASRKARATASSIRSPRSD